MPKTTKRRPNRRAERRRPSAPPAALFAALGDETRLALLDRLSEGGPRSISQLARGTSLSRQAVSKHLGVLRESGFVRSARHGRERRYEFTPERLEEMHAYLESVTQQWERALGRLKDYAES